MKQEAIAKAATTKKMNQLAGARPTLPGHDRSREEILRAELTASFNPVGAAEMLWVGDIAYCSAVIEVIRAQIAGVYARQVENAHEQMIASEELQRSAGMQPVAERSQIERHRLEAMAEQRFIADWRHTYLDDPVFASLLAGAGSREIAVLRMLQQLLHDQTKERDRIINQFERRRRNAMRDAIELAEEARRVELFRRLSPAAITQGDHIEDATFETIAPDSDAPAADRAKFRSLERGGAADGAIPFEDSEE